MAFSAPRGSGQLRSAVTLQQPPSALPIGGSAYFQPPPSKSRHVAVKRYQDADETGFVTAYRCDHGNKGNNNLSPVFSRQSNHAGRDEDAASVPLPSPKPVNYKMSGPKQPSSHNISLQPTNQGGVWLEASTINRPIRVMRFPTRASFCVKFCPACVSHCVVTIHHGHLQFLHDENPKSSWCVGTVTEVQSNFCQSLNRFIPLFLPPAWRMLIHPDVSRSASVPPAGCLPVSRCREILASLM